MDRRQAGSTKFEFSVVAAVLAVLAWQLLVAIQNVQADAEKIVVDLTIRNLRMAVKLQVSDRIISGRERELGDLLRSNPVTWMDPVPDGYAGERDDPEFGWLAAGQWGFDRSRRQLGYRPRIGAGLSIDDGTGVLRWRLEARKAAVAGGEAARHEGFDVVPVANYRWQP